jgi:hypothetical protein
MDITKPRERHIKGYYKITSLALIFKLRDQIRGVQKSDLNSSILISQLNSNYFKSILVNNVVWRKR